MSRTVIIIPSRIAATRLRGKPLLKINNKPIISHVFDKAKLSGIGEVFVATEDKEIMDVVKQNGGKAILTGKHKTGTDRIYEAFNNLKLKNIDYVLNIQGDEPAIEIRDIINLNNLMIENNSNIGSLAAEISKDSVMKNENVVKVITKEKLKSNNFPKVLNFFRKNLLNNINNNYIYHHIGIYSYKVSILEKFVNLDQTKNEITHKLEQLRALDNGININLALASSSPIGVDTMEDYMELKKIMEYKS